MVVLSTPDITSRPPSNARRDYLAPVGTGILFALLATITHYHDSVVPELLPPPYGSQKAHKTTLQIGARRSGVAVQSVGYKVCKMGDSVRCSLEFPVVTAVAADLYYRSTEVAPQIVEHAREFTQVRLTAVRREACILSVDLLHIIEAT